MIIKTIIKPFQKDQWGSLRISRIARKFFESQNIKRVLGLNLVGAILIMSVFSPTSAAFNEQEAVINNPETNVSTVTAFRIPVEGFITQNYRWYHEGIDIAGNFEKPIYPIAQGKIREVEYGTWGYGHKVIIDHEGNYSSLYAHMGQINVKVGDEVTKDTVLGFVGITGWTTGPHLHLEIHKDEQAINPAEVLPEMTQNLSLQ